MLQSWILTRSGANSHCHTHTQRRTGVVVTGYLTFVLFLCWTLPGFGGIGAIILTRDDRSKGCAYFRTSETWCKLITHGYVLHPVLRDFPVYLRNCVYLFVSLQLMLRLKMFFFLIQTCRIIFISVPCNSPWYTNYKTNYLNQCIVLKNLLHFKSFYTY